MAAALGRGDALRVYEALRRVPKAALSSVERSILDDLLRDRRSFARPYGEYPLLLEFFGCGFRLAGGSDADPASGTFVATQWLLLLGVRLWPVRSFLVRELTPGLRRSRCEYARVPMSAWDRRKRVLVPLLWALVVGVIVHAEQVLVARRTVTAHRARAQDAR